MKNRINWLITLVATLLLGALPAHVFAQATNTASLIGKVTDASGAPLPGVTVVVTSPQLQVPQVTGISDDNGDYKVLNLPAPGVYTITVTLSGFERFVRRDINLGVGFAGRVDVPMKIGEVNQTVEVQGGNPVIDTTSASTSTVLEEAVVQETPKGMGIYEMIPMATGGSLQGKPDVGDSNLAARSPFITYGVIMVPTFDVENINMDTDKAADTAVYLDSFSISEAEFKAVGNNADVAYPGIDAEMVMKGGSNTYHGNVRGDLERPGFQSANVPNPASGNPLIGYGYYDYNADGGGFIIKDKLWEYGGYSFQGVQQGSPNFVAAPGNPTSAPCNYANYWLYTLCPTATTAGFTTSLKEWNVKVSYQPKPRVKILFGEMHGSKYLEQNGGSATTPLSASQFQGQPTQMYHGEIQATITPKFLLDAGFGHQGYRAIYETQPASVVGQYGFTSGTDFVGSPSQEEVNTASYTGPYYFPQNRPQYGYAAKVFASFVPSAPHLGGTHQLKIGTEENWDNAGTAVLGDKPSGDYLLQFNNVATNTTASATGCTINTTPSGCPYRIVLYNFPFPNSTNHNLYTSGYITEQYTHKRLTLNLGVRGENWNESIPKQAKTAGQFSNIFPAVTYPEQFILSWTDIVPRVGAAFDIFGNGKTVVKADFGMFGDTMGDLFANGFNADAEQTNTYNWQPKNVASAACQPTAGTTSTAVGPTKTTPIQYNCDVSSAFLTYLATQTPVSQTGATSQIQNPGLKQDKTYEFAASLERQIVPNVSVTATWVQHRQYNLYNGVTNNSTANNLAANPSFNGAGITVGRATSSYSSTLITTTGTGTAPLQYLDVSPAGVSTVKTLYTYGTAVSCGGAPCAAGTTASEIVNNPSSSPDTFNSFEVGVTKKYSKKWTGYASFWDTKSHRWIDPQCNGTAAIVGSPNDCAFPLDLTWNWEARVNLTYALPWRINLYTYWRAQSGIPGARYDAVSSNTNVAQLGLTPTTASSANGPLAQGTTYIAQEAYGSERGPLIEVWNFKAAKVFKFKDRYSVEANYQLYNILNSNAAVATTYLSGSTYGQTSSIVSPRVYRFGGVFSF